MRSSSANQRGRPASWLRGGGEEGAGWEGAERCGVKRCGATRSGAIGRLGRTGNSAGSEGVCVCPPVGSGAIREDRWASQHSR